MKTAVFYEREYYEEALNLLDTYSKFMKRENKIRQDRKHLHINFINAMRKLLAVKLNIEKNGKSELMRSIVPDSDKLILSKWVIQCIGKL